MGKFFSNIKQFFISHWKILAATAGPVLLIVIVLSLPLKIVPIAVTETYLATETQSQPYNTQETYQDNEAYTDAETTTETVYDSYASGYNWSYSFTPKPNSTISVSINGMAYNPPPYIYWGDNTTGPFFPGAWINFYGWNSSSRVVIKMTYPVTKYRVVTRTREVIKYRDVEITVQKERMVTRYYRMSIWAYLFMDRSNIAPAS